MATITEIAGTKQQKKVLRTAAYCRVSSDSLDQLHSFAAQVQHYTKAISQNPNMELADIYADEGLTGTKTDKRDDFNRLIADCRKGKIDRVLTKSVSRFARNTVDSLMYARMLKEYGVSILFEKENIDTAYMSSELLLALSGAQAQEESISISKNMRWSVERRMKSGTYLSSSTPYGYKLEEGEFKVVETEAEIVRLIFKSYLSGMGKKAIADMLNRMDAPKRFGYTTWRISTINYILSNERYIGDALFQKRYTTDTLPFKMKINRGQKPQYYVEDMNPPIITKEVFEAAQKLKAKSTTEERFSVQERPLREKIKCGCGHIYKPITVNGKIYWECRMHNFDSQKCSSRRIPETDIYEAFITMVNKLRNCYEEILPPAIAQTERLQMKADGLEIRIKQIDKEIADLNNKNLILARLNSKGILRAAEYSEQSNGIRSMVNGLRSERCRLLREQDDDSILCGLRRLHAVFTELTEPVTAFDETVFQEIVQQITVPSHTSICFYLIGGLNLTEKIPEQRRCRRK